MDLAKVPDLVAVEDDDGDVVGYAWKQDIFGTDAGPGPDVIDVWDVTGTERLGRVYPDGVGFLTRDEERSLGATPTQAPTPTAAIAPTTVVE